MISIIRDLYKKTGLNIFPGKGKMPITQWKKYQETRITEFELERLLVAFQSEISSVGIICGVDGVECIDIDNKDEKTTEILRAFRQLDFFSKLYVESTPSGGYHILYRCEEVEGNTVLARNKKKEAIIETRGRGGWVVISPSPSYTPLQGTLQTLPLLTPEERAILFSIAKDFDADLRLSDGLRPGDDYSQRGDHRKLLEPEGWVCVGFSNGYELWRRPGKSGRKGSATWNPDLRLFHVFTTNAPPLRAGESYTLFRLFAFLKHNGNFSKAARELLALGFGQNGEMKEVEPRPKSDPVLVATQYLSENYDFRYNEVLSSVEFRPKGEEKWIRMLDRHLNAIWMTLREMDIRVSATNLTQVVEGKLAEPFHPFQAYFASLPPWDGYDYIDDFLACFETPTPDLLEFYFRKWIVGVVAMAIEKGRNDHCFTLLGPQGVGKTSILGYLVPEALQQYYAVSNIDPADKDASILLAENFLINLDELETSTRDEIGHLKSLMTKDALKIRRPYAHRHEVLKRHASFCGSVNRANFLIDATGARRFFVVEVTKIHFPSSFPVDMLYSQALRMLENGFIYWLSASEVEEVNEANEPFRLVPPEEEFIQARYEPVELPPGIRPADLEDWCKVNGYEIMTASEILNELLEAYKVKNMNVRNVGIAMQRLGFKKVQYGPKFWQRKGYVVKKLFSLSQSFLGRAKFGADDDSF